MPANTATFQDIAQYTGLSKTTISRYFNKPDTVSPANREKIRRALDVLNYKENKVAKILAEGHTEFIGLLIPNLYFSFFAEVLDRFLSTYENHGYKFLVFIGDRKADLERQYLSELQAYHAEGLIVLSHTLPSFELLQFGLPVVTIEREDQYVSSVNTDNLSGALQAVRLLQQSKCDVYIHINSSDDDPRTPAYDRLRGFTSACDAYRLPSEIIRYDSETDYHDLEQKIERILDQIIETYPGKRKGIFCSSDSIANIVLNSLLRRFGHFPDDYALVGFDDSLVSQRAVLPISSVAQQTDLLVENAMDLLQEQIRQKHEGKLPPFEPVHRTVAPILRVRETAKP